MRFAIAVVMLVATAGQARATMLLNSGAETQIEAWLGQGNLAFDGLFTKSTGSNSSTWHAAVDGKGPTITLIEVISAPGYGVTAPQIIGFYNPTSWSSSGDYTYSPPLAPRTAFLFNLTTGLVLSQKDDIGSNNFGLWQSYNEISSGPTVGGGHDLYVNSTLQQGYAYAFSYGSTLAAC